MKKAKCTNCGHTQHLGEKVGWKIAMAAGGAALGAGAMKKHPLAMLGLGLLGAAVGHAMDTNLLPNCPNCRVALQLVNSVV
jgi:hypothetical protein